MFTIALLWHFKPEDRAVLPIVDEEEEPGQESKPLMELNGSLQESSNNVLEAWDRFLLSTTEIEVPKENFMMEMVIPMSEFKCGIVELPEAAPQQFNDMPKQFVLPNASLMTKKIDESAILREGEVSIWDSRISFNSKPVPKLIRSRSLQERLGFSTAATPWFYYFAESNIPIALPSPE
ncbi:hypothetical protein A2U01_0038014, partial [Trifolium medium]|nr:hypothetical protein [Trifolium medium]